MYVLSCGPIANYGIHTLTPKKPEKADLGIDRSRVRNMFKVFEKTQYFTKTLYQAQFRPRSVAART